jgi:hypothetical protein
MDVGILEVAVAATSLIISLGTILGWVAFLGSWKTKVEASMDRHNKCAETVPNAVQDLKTKMDLVWQVQTLEVLERQKLALHHEGPFTERNSPLRITDRGQRCLELLGPMIRDMKALPGLKPSDVPKVVNEKIGLAKLDELAHEQQCTVNELLALITVELGFGL